jgi:hypothetical protein
MEISNHWSSVLSSLSRKMEYIDFFLQWPEIIDTMVFDDQNITAEEKNYISENSKHNWRDILVYNGTGNGKRSNHFPQCMNNQLHQYFHLTKFENMRNVDIRDYDTIIEFGGGYGEMCRIAKSIKPSINYHIIDLPELHIIQDFYLKGNNIKDYSQINAAELPDNTGKTIFLSFWAISEVPIELRHRVFEYLCRNKIDFFISYQSAYESYNNTDFFTNMKLDGYKITKEQMTGNMLDNCYLLGEYRE